MDRVVIGSAVVAVLSFAVVAAAGYHATPHPQPIPVKYVDEHGRPLSNEVAERLLRERREFEVEQKLIARQLREQRNAREREVSASPYNSTYGGGFAGSRSSDDRQYVRGHYRSNGTYVEGYYRSRGNSTERDNWSTRGNVNPVTGKRGSARANR